MAKILLVDDEPRIARVVRDMVEGADWQFAYADNGADALDAVARETPDLIIMDVMMPKMDGFTACRELRTRGVTVPVIFLSAKGDIVDKGVGFAAGGDDYIGKPYSLVELELRLRLRIQRHLKVETGEVLRYGALEVDLGLREARFQGEAVALTALEFDLLAFLARNPDMVFSYEQLYDRVWKAPMNQGLHNIQVCMARVRQKLDALKLDDETRAMLDMPVATPFYFQK